MKQGKGQTGDGSLSPFIPRTDRGRFSVSVHPDAGRTRNRPLSLPGFQMVQAGVEQMAEES